MLVSTLPNNLAMSSLEIAALTGKKHLHVIRDIKKMISDLYDRDATNLDNRIDPPSLGNLHKIDDPNMDHPKIQGITVTKDKRGYISRIDLDYSHTITLVTGYDTKARKKVVDRWMALEAKEQSTPTIKPSPRKRKPAFDVAFKRLLNVAELLPTLDANQKRLKAARGTYELTGVNPLELLGETSLPAPTNENYLTPTEIGTHIGLSGQRINQVLIEQGYQIRVKGSSTGSSYEPTEKGKDVSRFFDTTRTNGKGSQQQLKWSNQMVSVLRPFAPRKEKVS
ncbi:hypothetical protein E3D00_07495 [Swingsia samuiensis]|uniref:Antirepressor protein C-terminal domain-containing protein n=2 Tax=Swingsia samuiensis TaxID=1293412 RepID=A0A4Y6UNV6_9PROT|nr:hypothetical protein E3D00_07495 [Swingsia samuiensis]